MEKTNEEILAHAKLVVWGAMCGDIIGSVYEFRPIKNYDFDLLKRFSRPTDDSVCTVAIADALVEGKPFDESLRDWCRRYPYAGYGGSFRRWIEGEIEGPYNSWGNGSAMRVSPVAADAQSYDEAMALAADSARVTHNHPEGIKGAQATAAAIYLALRGKSKAEIKERIETDFGYDLSRPYASVQPGYKFDVSCTGSVPESVICFLEGTDYESTVRLAVAMGGDADTMAAIAGGIAAAYYGEIPEPILQACGLRVPEPMDDVIEKFNRLLDSRFRS